MKFLGDWSETSLPEAKAEAGRALRRSLHQGFAEARRDAITTPASTSA
jgi:hypothetical protein